MKERKKSATLRYPQIATSNLIGPAQATGISSIITLIV